MQILLGVSFFYHKDYFRSMLYGWSGWQDFHLVLGPRSPTLCTMICATSRLQIKTLEYIIIKILLEVCMHETET
jgi:hypothetical protein